MARNHFAHQAHRGHHDFGGRGNDLDVGIDLDADVMWRFIPIILIAGCAEIKAPQPVSFPSVCWGEGKEDCERRKNAETLAAMGYYNAALIYMCSDPRVRNVLDEQCGNDAVQY